MVLITFIKKKIIKKKLFYYSNEKEVGIGMIRASLGRHGFAMIL
jgi:hypothetical protein